VTNVTASAGKKIDLTSAGIKLFFIPSRRITGCCKDAFSRKTEGRWR